MTHSDDIQQRLLEWQYGLLSDEEVAELQQQIADNPELVAAAEDARRLAEVFARAANLPVETEVSSDTSDSDQASGGRESAGTDGGAAAHRSPEAVTEPRSLQVRPATTAQQSSSTRGTQTWLKASLVLAGLYFVFLLGGDRLIDKAEEQQRVLAGQIAPDQIRLSIEQTSAASFDAAGKFQIRAELADESPAEVQLSYSVRPREGKPIFASAGVTDALGRFLLALPANLSIPDGAELHVEAKCEVPGVEVTAVSSGSLRLVPTRYLTHLSMDRTLYRPGELVHYRSLTLERFSLSATEEFPVHFEIIDPSGTVVPGSQHDGITTRGVGTGVFAIPKEQVGGEYTLIARSHEGSFPEEVRKFQIRNYRVPRLRKELEFQKDSYGPGDLVVADFFAKQAEGGPSKGASINITAVVDEQTVLQHNAQADDNGSAHVEFRIPENIEIGDGRLTVVVDDGGTRETLTKTIPIQLDRIDVTFYPAGGDIVPGLQNVVYFVARNPQGEPVHIAGDIVDSRSRKLADTEVLHDGMGRFSFTPAFGESFRMVLTKPKGLRASFDLPQPNAEQVVAVDAGDGVFAAGSSPELVVSSTKPMPNLLVTAYCRGTLMAHQTFAAKTGPNPVVLSLPGEAGGVLRVTVHDNSVSPPRPLAERLIYRRAGRELNIKVVGNEEPRAPGDRVRLQLQVTNEHGKPVPAALGIAAVDDSTLVLADDKYPNLPAHFLVTSEIESPEDLEDAEFYLSDDPEAVVALDLLMGTQGWRRFVEKRLVDLQQDPVLREQVERLIALNGKTESPANFTNAHELRRNELSLGNVRQIRATFHVVCVILGIGLLLNLLLSALFGGKRPDQNAATLTVLMIGCVGSAVGVLGCGQGDSGAQSDADVVFAPEMADDAAVANHAESAEEEMSFMMERQSAMEGAEPEMPKAVAPGGPMADMAVPAEADPAAMGHAGPPAPAANGLAATLPDSVAVGAGMIEVARNVAPNDAALQKYFAGMTRLNLTAADIQRFRSESMSQDELSGKRFTVREYSFRQRQRRGTTRDDFTETIYWNPLVIADEFGHAVVEFDLSDSITTFRVTAHAHSNGGRIGSGDGEVISRRPFYLEPKLPLEVTQGDRIDLPVAAANGTGQDQPASFGLQTSDLFALNGTPNRSVTLAANGRAREIFALNVTGNGRGMIAVNGSMNGDWTDSVKRPLTSVSQGFPVEESLAGILKQNENSLTLKLPPGWTPDSLNVALRVFPNPVSEAQQSLAGMLRNPGGCFEQTTSSNYPNTMVLRMLSGSSGQAYAGVKPATIRRAKEFLKKGYARLTGYESASGGFEWFGGDPGHEALTAMGLMQFYDMKPVFPVDEEMLERTTKWLLSRRDGEGSFHINPRFLHNWGAPQDTLSAYIVWALTETHEPLVIQQISRELSRVQDVGAETDDPYLLALCAASLSNAGMHGPADQLLGRLEAFMAADGSLEGAVTVTVSGGFAKKVETTALAALAWQKRPSFSSQAARALNWLRSNRRGGGHFGSTQATVLALKALLGNPQQPSGDSSGTITVAIGDTQVGDMNDSDTASGAPTLVIPASALQPGENTLVVSNGTGADVSYAIDLQYHAARPANDDQCPLRLTTKLSSETVEAGEVVSLEATLTNSVDRGQPMSMVALGLPAGLEPRTEQLDELRDDGVIDFYELRNREVICYWRTLEANQQIDLRLDLTAEIPGKYTGPASRTWLYYTAEQKQWADPLVVEIGAGR